MNCPECQREVPEGNRFCSACGTGLTPAPSICPQCGSSISTSEKFCGQCGRNLSRFLPVAVVQEALIIATGSIFMFGALIPHWYQFDVEYPGFGTISYWESYFDLNASAGELLRADLLTESATSLWAGVGLPIVLLICIASLVLLPIVVSLWTGRLRGRATRWFWCWMGILAIICVVANVVYVSWWTHDYGDSRLSIENGPILALIGGVVIVVGANRLFLGRVISRVTSVGKR